MFLGRMELATGSSEIVSSFGKEREEKITCPTGFRRFITYL
jgi:hypothetical protein